MADQTLNTQEEFDTLPPGFVVAGDEEEFDTLPEGATIVPPTPGSTTPSSPEEMAQLFPQIGGMAPSAPGAAQANARLGQHPTVQAAQAGVDVLTGIHPSVRFALSFSPTRAHASEYLRAQGYTVRANPADGELEFLNPEAVGDDGLARWTRVNEARMSLGDLSAAVGVAPTFLLDATSNLLLGRVRGTAGLLGRGGATYGAVLWGETGRLLLGRQLGYNTLTDGEIEEYAAANARTAAVGGVAAEMGGAAAVRLVAPLAGYMPKEVAAMQGELAATDPVVREISARTGARFSPTLGQRLDDPDLLNLEANFDRSQSLKAERDKLRKNNESTLRAYADTTLGGQSGIRESAGVKMREAMSTQNTRLTEGLETRLAREKEAATRAVQSLPTLSAPVVGRNTRTVVADALDAAKAQVDPLWATARQVMGYNPQTALSNVKIPASPAVADIVNQLQRESDEAVFSQRTAGKMKLLSARIRNMPRHRDPETGRIAAGEPIDLWQLQNALSDIRRWKRVARRGESVDDPSVKDLSALEDALLDARNSALNNSKLLRQLEAAELASFNFHKTFDRGLLSTIVERDGAGGYTLRPKTIFNDIFRNNDGEAAQELAGLAYNDPQAMQLFRNAMFALYRKEATKDNLPVRALHDKFMENHEEVMRAFFSKKDWADFERFGTTADTITKQNVQLQKLLRDLKVSTRGAIENTSPEALTTKFFGTPSKAGDLFDAEGVRNTVRVLGKSPEGRAALAGWKDSVSDELKRRIRQEGTFNVKAIDDILAAHGDKLRAMYGEQYIADLNTLRNGVSLIARRGSTTNPLELKEVVGYRLLRILMPPLTVRGRAQTAAETIRIAMGSEALFDFVTNPDKLHELLRLRNSKLSNPAVQHLLGSSYVLSGIYDPYEEE